MLSHLSVMSDLVLKEKLLKCFARVKSWLTH